MEVEAGRATVPGPWWVVVPVKGPARAKSRLEVGDGRRPGLAAAFAADTVRALLACPLVAGVLVVGDRGADPEPLRALGADVLTDGTPAGLNPALQAGFAALSGRHPGAPLAAVLGDLPALRPESVAAALAIAAAAAGTVFVADAPGTGTTLLADARSAPVPHFGGGSAAAHRAAGGREISALVPADLRRDVDTTADLADAARLGVGPATAAALAADPAG